jgi:hypothetical protein
MIRTVVAARSRIRQISAIITQRAFEVLDQYWVAGVEVAAATEPPG